MPLVPFPDLLADARRRGYAVGYFESWSLESFLAVADAAEARRAPVILGFSGIYLPHPERHAKDPLAPYASMALAVCRSASVPASLLFNESPNRRPNNSSSGSADFSGSIDSLALAAGDSPSSPPIALASPDACRHSFQ